jgi:multicomponent Na+:H+ antiporter subunit E
VNRVLLALVLLTATYVLVLASLDPVDVLTGAAASAAVLLLFHRFLFGERPTSIAGLPKRILAAPRFAWAVLVDITVGTWRVAAVVLGIRPLSHPGIVLVPIGDRTEMGVVVSACAATLAPGEYLVDIDWERRCMLMHVLDASEPDAVREQFADFYRRHQRKFVA